MFLDTHNSLFLFFTIWQLGSTSNIGHNKATVQEHEAYRT